MTRKVAQIGFVCTAVLMAGGSSGQGSDSLWARLTTAPRDTADARNCRIWHHVKHSQRCRVTVGIFDSRGTSVRKMLSRLLSSGYYNFYWDKRNDSGEFVPAGEYGYRIEDCGVTDSGTVVARFKRWELLSTIRGNVADSLPIEVELFADSAGVSVAVFNRRGEVVSRPVTDTVLGQGLHSLVWNREGSLRQGRYSLEITVGDFIYYRDVRVR